MRFPNRIYGEEAAPYTYHNEQSFPFGQVMELPNGRLFRYGRVGAAASVANKLQQSFVTAGNWDAVVVQTQTAVGDPSMALTNATTTITENLFAEGTVCSETAATLGHIYPIKSNTAITTGTYTVTLADGVTVRSVMTTSHKVCVHPNPYTDFILKPGSLPTAMCIGIPSVVAPVGAHQWLCSHGVASCLITGTPTIGYGLRADHTSAGAVLELNHDEATNANAGRVGWTVEIGATGDFGHIFLTLD